MKRAHFARDCCWMHPDCPAECHSHTHTLTPQRHYSQQIENFASQPADRPCFKFHIIFLHVWSVWFYYGREWPVPRRNGTRRSIKTGWRPATHLSLHLTRQNARILTSLSPRSPRHSHNPHSIAICWSFMEWKTKFIFEFIYSLILFDVHPI